MFDYHRAHQVDIRIARIFNTYGPRMAVDDGRVVSNFVVQALQNQPLVIYGDGTQTRSFCYVSDMVEALCMLMNASYVGMRNPINLGNPIEFTIRDLANKIIEFTKSKSKILFLKLPEDDPKQRRPDIELAKKKLNWQPKISLEEGLQKVIHFFSLQK